MRRLVVVKTCKKNTDRRAACEDTWVRDLRRRNISVRFALGDAMIPGLDDKNVYVAVRDGMAHNLSYPATKLQAVVTKLLGLPFDYLFVTDDDTYVHPSRWFARQPNRTCDLECRVFRPKLRHSRHQNIKSWIHGGAGWYMSRRLCELFARETVTGTMNDDVILGHLARVKNMMISDLPQLYGCDRYGKRHEEVSRDNELMTCHHVTPERMRSLHAELE